MSRYRIVFGVGRSGTTWISTVLAKTPTPIRFLREPLHSKRRNDTFRESISYEENICALIHKYNTYMRKETPKIACKNKRIIRNDENFEYCLIKEPHGLLAAEHVIKNFDSKVLLITRDVLYILDSLLCLPELNNTYLKAEARHMSSDFLKKFTYLKEMPSYIVKEILDKRRSLIVEKLLTVAILNKMFHKLNAMYDNVRLVHYEDFCKDPSVCFRKIFDFFDFKYDNSVENFLEEINTLSNNKARSYRRVTSEQLGKRFKYLFESEIDMCLEILEKNFLL